MQITDEINTSIAAKGLAIYNAQLKGLLEPDHDNEYVVIHVDTGDYAVSRRSSDAVRIMLQRHGADGRLCELHIGPEPESALVDRYLRNDQPKGLSQS